MWLYATTCTDRESFNSVLTEYLTQIYRVIDAPLLFQYFNAVLQDGDKPKKNWINHLQNYQRILRSVHAVLYKKLRASSPYDFGGFSETMCLMDGASHPTKGAAIHSKIEELKQAFGFTYNFALNDVSGVIRSARGSDMQESAKLGPLALFKYDLTSSDVWEDLRYIKGYQN